MTRRSSRHLSPALAFAVAAAGIGLFSVMDAFMKSLTLAIGVYNALLWRMGAGSLFGAVAWGAGGGGWPTARDMQPWRPRGALTTAMALLVFWGLARVPMAQAISLAYIAPLLALVLGAALLKERVGRRVIVASLAALAGVGVILAGQSRGAAAPDALAGAIAILASAVLYAFNLIVARLQSHVARPGEIAFVQSAIVTLILLLAAPCLAHLPAAGEWPKILVAAALATASLFLLAWAYAHGETGYLATTEYTSFVYAAGLGWLVFGERVATATLLGAAIIVGACLYGARRSDIAAETMEPMT